MGNGGEGSFNGRKCERRSEVGTRERAGAKGERSCRGKGGSWKGRKGSWKELKGSWV